MNCPTVCICGCHNRRRIWSYRGMSKGGYKDAEGPWAGAYKEQLRTLGLLSLEKSEGKPHCNLQLPLEGKRRGRHWFLLSGNQQQDLSEQHGAVRGDLDRMLEKARGWLGTDQAPQGSAHSTELDTAPGVFGHHSGPHGGWLLECPVWGQEVDFLWVPSYSGYSIIVWQ